MISVIVPAHNADGCIEKCVKALLAQVEVPEEYEIIVVDDGSSNSLVRLKQYPGVAVLSQPHRGPAAARNLGARHARGSLLLFTDADCEPAQDWIKQMHKAFARGEIVGAKGAYRTRQRSLVARFVQLEFEEKYDVLKRRTYIDFVDTYSAAYRREIFFSSGAFDESFPDASVEDVDLSFRLAQKGYRMAFVPEAVVYHQHPSTVSAYLRRKFRFGFWRAAIYGRYPRKALADSRTPLSLRVQIVLTAALALIVALMPILPSLLPLALAVLGVVVLSTLPLTVRAARADAPVAVVATPLSIARALASIAGLAAGALYLAKKNLASHLAR